MCADKTRDRSPIDRKRRVQGGGNKSGPRRAPPECRVFVSNIPWDMKWQELKDLFREQVGDVTYVELFNDENEKPRGCGILEFGSKDLAKKAVEKMHRHDLKGRKLVVKEDFDVERDKAGRIVKGSGTGSTGGRDRDQHRSSDRDQSRGGVHDRLGPQPASSAGFGNTYGLSPQFLESLGIDGPLHTRVFVANLSYNVDEKKLREVFRLAGRCVTIELGRDKEGKSRGHAIVEYDHPVEAVQAISMFNNQMLYDRKMAVRLDKQPGMTPEEQAQLPSRLPEGLSGVGMGLGSNGNPLTEVAKNIANPGNTTSSTTQSSSSSGLGGLLSGVSQTSTAATANDLAPAVVALLARQVGLNLTNNAALNTVAGALAGNLPLGGAAGGGNMNMTNAGLNNLASNLGGIGGMLPNAGLNLGNGLGNNLTSGGLGGLAGSMGSQGSMSNMNMGSGLNMGSGSGMNLPMNPPSGMDSMGSRSGSNLGSVNPFNQGAGSYGAGSMGRAGTDGPSSGASRGGMAGSGGRSSDTIIIRNLPAECNWQDLRELFSSCGEVKYAEMKDRGTGLVRFTSERDAERAVSMMDNTIKGGRLVDVRLY